MGPRLRPLAGGALDALPGGPADEAISGQGVQWRHASASRSRRGGEDGLRLAARLPRLGHHPAGPSPSSPPGATRSCGTPCGTSASTCCTPARSTRGRHRRTGVHADHRRLVRPHLARHRPGSSAPRRSTAGWSDVAGEREALDRRRPGAAAHRHRARLPPRRAGVQGLPRHVHDGRDRPGGLGAPAGGRRPVATAPRPEGGGRAAAEEGLHPRPDQLQRRPPRGQRRGAAGAPPARSSAPTARRAGGSTCTTSSRASRRSTGSTRRYAARPRAVRRRRPERPRPRRQVVRLDAVPFLGHRAEAGRPTEPCTISTRCRCIGTTDWRMLVRKLGGWTLPRAERAAGAAQASSPPNGPDLSYDFFTRAQVLHALLTGDAAPLRLALGFLLEAGMPAGPLVHDLQNHDEITYQLVELGPPQGRSSRVRGPEADTASN